MKSRVKNFRKVLRNQYMEGVDRVRRSRKGYGDEETGDDYHDVSEDLELEDFFDESQENEGVSQSKRKAHGYKGEDPVDYDTSGLNLYPEGCDKEDLTEVDPQSLAQKGASRIRTGQEVGADFRSRADAAVQALLGTARSSAEKRSLFQLINKPTTAGGFKDSFLGTAPDVPAATPSPAQGQGGEDPSKWDVPGRGQPPPLPGKKLTMSKKLPPLSKLAPPEEEDGKKKKSLSHAAERGSKANFPGPPVGESLPDRESADFEDLVKLNIRKDPARLPQPASEKQADLDMVKKMQQKNPKFSLKKIVGL